MANRRFEHAYKLPEQQILGAILTKAVEDTYRLPKIKNKKDFDDRLFDLWDFFNGEWFLEILEILEINPDLKEWEEIRSDIIRFSRGRIKADGTKK